MAKHDTISTGNKKSRKKKFTTAFYLALKQQKENYIVIGGMKWKKIKCHISLTFKEMMRKMRDKITAVQRQNHQYAHFRINFKELLFDDGIKCLLN